MYHKCKPDSSGLNIIADIMCCMRFHLVLYHIYIFQISIVSFDILILFLVLFNFFFFFTQAVKTILHFNPEREHLDSEEATAFFSSPFVTATNKTVASKTNQRLKVFVH